MQGSDTLKDITKDIIANHCPSVTSTLINYVGGGSGTGEFAMFNGTQQIAPMSRTINAAACTTGAATTGEQMVIAFDALSVVANDAAAPGCGLAIKGDTIPVTDQNRDPKTGAAITGIQCLKADGTDSGLCPGGTYTITDWQDVLRIIYADNLSDASKTLCTGADAGKVTCPALKSPDCNSDLRWSLVNNWGKLFHGSCTGNGQNCTKLKHAFRRDDLSGTTDAFLSLLGLQGVNSANLVSGNVVVSWNNPFCNGGADPVVHDAAHGGTGVATYKRVVLDKTDQTGDPFGAGVTQPSNHFGDHFATFMDYDPIRQKCTGDGNSDPTVDLGLFDPEHGGAAFGNGSATHGEQVCGPKGDSTFGLGDLGLVLVISPADNLTAAQNYPTVFCTEGKQKFVQGPDFPYACPNGGKTLFGKCFAPYFLATPTSAPNFACINEPDNNTTFSPANTDGRAHNLFMRDAATGDLLQNGDGLNMIGSWHRLHVTTSMTGVVCNTALSATDQIGCLMGSTPCSIGFAGHSADQQAHTQVLTINGVTPAVANIQFQITGTDPGGATGKYPLSRKLYLNTQIGWEHVTGPELDLAKCFAGSSWTSANGQTAMRGTGTNSSANEVVAQGFFNTVGGVTSCEPATNCGATDVTTVCGNNPAPFPTTKVW